jgi:hypothetical protein
MTVADADTEAVSRWHPEGIGFWLTRPRRTLRAIAHAPAAIRFDTSLPPSVTRWTFSHAAHDGRVVVTFHDPEAVSRLLIRWRLLTDIIRHIARSDRGLFFRDVLIDLGDGVDTDAAPNLLAFARRPGSQARLIPNPYLLRPRPWLGPALPWILKRDSVYFRGASTGAIEYDGNTRVALCRVAKTIPRADCRVSRIKQVDERFAARLEQEGLVGWRMPAWAMNGHRFLVEADGNSSSWDRYMLIGSFGGVPIRFECEWEECWHGLLVDGVNCVVADRHTLPEVVDRLRSRPREAMTIAYAASSTVAESLGLKRLRRQLAAVLASA